MARKRNEYENITDSNLEKVINLLEAEKPITKKSACEILSIAYNTSRLTSLIEAYKAKKARDLEMRAQKRYTAPTADEINLVVTSYLEGEPVSSIAASLYRSEMFVKNVLERTGCPRRVVGADYWHPELIPEAAMKEKFQDREKVWSARYNSMATVYSEVAKQPGVYKIWLDSEEWQQFAFQPYWELASLEHLRKQGITV